MLFTLVISLFATILAINSCSGNNDNPTEENNMEAGKQALSKNNFDLAHIIFEG